MLVGKALFERMSPNIPAPQYQPTLRIAKHRPYVCLVFLSSGIVLGNKILISQIKVSLESHTIIKILKRKLI